MIHRESPQQAVSSIRDKLDAAQVGFNGSKQFVGLLGPKPFFVEWGDMLAAGQATWQWITTCNALYRRALDGDAELGFVRDLIESEAPPELVALNRKIARSDRLRPPCFVRLDMPAPGKAVEAQIPGSGWGYRLALIQAFRGHVACCGYLQPDFVSAFATAVRTLTGKDRPRVVHVRRTDDFARDDLYFARAVQVAGIDYRTAIRAVPNPQEVDLILRHYLQDFVKFPGADDALTAYLQGDLEIEPPPNLLTDQKIGMTLPFDPRTQLFFTEKVRALFPTTNVVGPEDIRRIMDQPARLRGWVLKYAGLTQDLRAQGKAVFNLSQCSRKCALDLEAQIAEKSEPWILQQLIHKKYRVCGEVSERGEIQEQELYARFTPIFALVAGEANMLACTANFRNFWKVSSHADSILLPVTRR